MSVDTGEKNACSSAAETTATDPSSLPGAGGCCGLRSHHTEAMVAAAGCRLGKPGAHGSLRAMVGCCRVPGAAERWFHAALAVYLLSEMLQRLSPWYPGVGGR